jgi:hypothetical protein
MGRAEITRDGYSDYEKTITWQATSRVRRSSVYAWEGQDQEEPRKDAAQRYRRRSLRTSLSEYFAAWASPQNAGAPNGEDADMGVTGDAKEEGGPEDMLQLALGGEVGEYDVGEVGEEYDAG